MLRITEQQIRQLSEEAAGSPRKRGHRVLSSGPEAVLQQFLLSMDLEAYVRPHRHAAPDRTEIFTVLKGRLVLLRFDDSGLVVESATLDPQGGDRAVVVKGGTWHTALALERGSVALIIKEGPYDPRTDKIFAAWAPEEGCPEAGDFRGRILQQLNLGCPS